MLLSVILPVRNGKDYIYDAVDSVLKQTYNDFELIIINDGSTDSTLQILKSFNDNRIKIITTEGIGLVNALNLAIDESSGTYIARMDADDICFNNRFEEQMKVLKNSNIGVVCADVKLIDEDGNVIGFSKDFYKNKNDLMNMLTFKEKRKPIIHPTAIINKKILHKIGGYRHFSSAEDRDLWLRLSNECEFYRIQKYLLKYRINSQGISKTKYFEQKVSSMLTVVCYEVEKKIGFDIYKNKELFLNTTYLLHNEIEKIKLQYETFENFKEKVKNKSKIDKINILLMQYNFIQILFHYFFELKTSRKLIEKIVKITIFEIRKKGLV